MKWLSGRCGNVLGFMAMSTVVAGVLSMVPATGHATGRTEGARGAATVVAKSRVAAAPRALPTPTRSAGCDEALVALALCKLSTGAAATTKRSTADGAAPDRRAFDPAPEQPAPKAIVGAATAAVEAPARLLPVFALGLAVAVTLLALFGFRAIASKAGREAAVGRSTDRSLGSTAHGSAFRIGFLQKSATAAIAKERLLHYRTAPQ